MVDMRTKEGRALKAQMEEGHSNPETVETVERTERDERQRERVPIGSGGKLRVPPTMLRDIEARGCVPRMVLDDKESNFDEYVAAGWEIYTDANGNQFRRPGGKGMFHVLMMIKKEFKEEDRKLRRKNSYDKLAAEQTANTSGPAPEFVEGNQAVRREYL